nr:nuclear pore complex protein NUP98A [Tanacetum cinerariifolium]
MFGASNWFESCFFTNKVRSRLGRSLHLVGLDQLQHQVLLEAHLHNHNPLLEAPHLARQISELEANPLLVCQAPLRLVLQALQRLVLQALRILVQALWILVLALQRLSANLFQSSSPALGPISSPFGQTGSAFRQTGSAFGQTGSASSSPFGTPTSAFGTSTSIFGTTQAQGTTLAFGTGMNFDRLGFCNLGFNQTPSSVPFQSTQPTPNSGFGFRAPVGGTSSIFGQYNNFGQMLTNQSPTLAQPQSITNPFGTLPAMPQMSIGRVGNAHSVQYGISSLPVVDKPAPMRISSLLTTRHLSQSRIRLPARKYHPKKQSSMVLFFSDEEETTRTPKADALFIPREYPRALVIRPLETWPRKASAKKPKGEYTQSASTSHQNGRPTDNGNGNHSENSFFKEQPSPVKITQKSNGLHDDQSTSKSDSYISQTGHRAEPRVQELAAKERAEPSFCRRVKDFTIGRHNYESIKLLGETDVRRLDLESLVQFNHRELIVYMDETKKSPVRQGLNKPAKVTLLNIKCSDKKTRKHFTEGRRVEKYTEMLKRKAEDQGAEFVSYDPIKREWNDFPLEKFDAFLALKDDLTSPEVVHSYFDTEGDVLLLEAFLNDDPSLPPPTQGMYFPQVRRELKIYEAKNDKSSIDEPPEVKLKDLPPHLEYAFLEGDDKFPVITAKDLSIEEKVALIKILMEDNFKPVVQHQRRVNLKIHDVIKKEGGVYALTIELNEATRKDHFPLPFMDQMLERLAENEYYCFLDGFSGYFQIPIDPKDQEKTTFTCPYRTFAYHRMPFGLWNAPGTFQRCMMAIFYDIIKKTMEVFMDDFSVFGNSFRTCLSHLEKMLKRCKDTNICLNWEKSHFMVKEGIVLGHKISKNGIEIAWPMTRLLEKDTSFFFSNECIEAIQTLKRKLTEAPILVAPDWDLSFKLMCDASDFAIEAFLNDDPSLPPPNQENYLPQVRKELKIYEAKTDKPSIDEPIKVELKDLPLHLKYAFLEGDVKFPVINVKYLSVEEKTALITVLKSHKRAITWKLSD